MTEPGTSPSHVADVDMLRRRVVNVVGHELRTPMTVLRGLADQLSTADVETVREQIAPALQRAAQRAEQLLDDLLVASGIDTALPVGEPRPVLLNEAVDRVWGSLGADAVLEASGEASVLARPDSVDRILRHLLDNEAKYGDGKVRVEISNHASTARVEIAAPMFPAGSDDVRLSFEPLYRGERGVTCAPGIGVGLPTARSLAHHEHGDVVIRDDGTAVCVELTLPAA